uniref:Uncharacterized protein n=1 Tax=Nelumbo nucifera TaxID=4432 RepID=A0A822YV22_NELNU|nr:TPA_asm: hypothetical protein HUJ06_005585 [Nelumbo nucifera]
MVNLHFFADNQILDQDLMHCSSRLSDNLQKQL